MMYILPQYFVFSRLNAPCLYRNACKYIEFLWWLWLNVIDCNALNWLSVSFSSLSSCANTDFKGLFADKFSLSSLVVSNILFLWEECARLCSLQLFLANILASQLLQIFMQKVFTGSEDRRGQWKIYLKKRKASTLVFLFAFLPKC